MPQRALQCRPGSCGTDRQPQREGAPPAALSRERPQQQRSVRSPVGLDQHREVASAQHLRKAADQESREGPRSGASLRTEDRKSAVKGTSVSVSVELGGRRIIKKQKKRQN